MRVRHSGRQRTAEVLANQRSFQIIDPKVDIGFDLAAEYAAACGLFGK